MSLIIITGKKFKSTQTFNTKIKNKKWTFSQFLTLISRKKMLSFKLR